MLFFRKSLAKGRLSEPSGQYVENCGMVSMLNVIDIRNWVDVPCRKKITSSYICKKTPSNHVDIERTNFTWSGHGCPQGLFLCRNKECVLNVFVCNGVQECRDGSDERNCSRCLQFYNIYLSVYAVLFLTMLCLINSRSHRHSVGKV